jgi:probable F420-dependent oxidoreductase
VRAEDATADLAAELEDLGYGSLWIGTSPAGSLDDAERALRATRSLIVATGVVNIWRDDAETVGKSYARLAEYAADRFLLGFGVGHPERSEQYAKPYEALVHYLDVLDEWQVPVTRRVLAALGPRVLQLAADRTAGAHPYLVPPAHTARARAVVGPDELLVPEHKVVLVDDPERARELARPLVAPYLELRNYASNLRRLGYQEADLAGGGSDRLVDAVVAHGTPEQVRDRLAEHLEAGADSVAIQVIKAGDEGVLPALRALAAVL